MQTVIIDIVGKYINTIPLEKKICRMDEQIDTFVFKMKSIYGDIDFSTSGWEFFLAYKDSISKESMKLLDAYSESEYTYLTWIPAFPETSHDINLEIQIRAKKDTEEGLIKWNTSIARVTLFNTFVENKMTKRLAEQYIDRMLQIYEGASSELIKEEVLKVFTEKGLEDTVGLLVGNGRERITSLVGENGTSITFDEGMPIVVNTTKPYTYMKQIDDYLFESGYSSKYIDIDEANKFFKQVTSLKSLDGGACTAVYINGKVLRHFDWFFSHESSFIIRRPQDKDKGIYKNIGITGATSALTKDLVESGVYTLDYNILPWFVVDGINEKGMYAQLNVVSKADYSVNINPSAEKETSVSMIIRLILDKCQSVDEVLLMLRDYHIYSSPVLSNDFHIFLADSTGKHGVLEFSQNEFTFDEVDVMTNFRIHGVSFDPDHLPDWATIEQFGNGVERYEIAQRAINNGETVESLRPLLMYTKMYTNPENERWFTEVCGKYDGYNITVMDCKNPSGEAKTHIDHVFEVMIEYYDNRTRDDYLTWQTTHSAIYDLNQKSINLCIQERANETRMIYLNEEDTDISDAIIDGLWFD